MVAAITIISNNSVPIGLANTMMNPDHGERSQDNNAAGDKTPTDGEDGLTTSDEDETIQQYLKVPEYNNENWVKSLDDWQIWRDNRVRAYYKTSSEMFEPKESDIKPDKFFWGTGALPEGDNYVCFYVIRPFTNEVLMSKVYHYKLDHTKPEDFELLLKQNLVLNEETGERDEFFTIINKEPLNDSLSGIAEAYYSVGKELSEQEADRREGTKISSIVKTEKGHDICFPVTEDMENKNVYVYAYDKSGNHKFKTIYVKNTEVPKFEYLGAFNGNDGNVSPSVTHSYGNDNDEEYPYTNYTYTSDVSYLKIKVSKSTKDNGYAIVKWDENGKEKDRMIELSKLKHYEKITDDLENPDHYDDPYAVYIPFSKLELNDGNYKFRVSVRENYVESADVELPEDFYYSKYDKDDDVIAEITPHEDTKNYIPDKFKNADGVDAYLKNKIEVGNNIVVNLEDDIGIAGYDLYIEKNWQNYKTISEDLTEGKTPEGETYYEPIKNYTSKPILLDDEGIYTLTLKVRDLEGNVRFYNYKFVVDPIAPTIDGKEGKEENDDHTYSAKPELNYTPQGIFSSKDLTLTIKVTENICNNIDSKGIVLHIVGEDGSEEKYTPNKQTKDGYEFNIKANKSGKAYITVTDKANNENTYYFTNFENNDDAKNSESLLVEDPLNKHDLTKTAKLIVCKDRPVVTIGQSGKNTDKIVVDGHEYFLFGNSKDSELSELTFSLHDNNGLVSHNIDITKKNDENGKEETITNHSEKYDRKNAVKDDSFAIPIEGLPTGRYDISGNVINLPGIDVAVQELGDQYSAFYVDADAPTICDAEYNRAQYTIWTDEDKEEKDKEKSQTKENKILKNIAKAQNAQNDQGEKSDEKPHLTFRNYGLFGNEKINITITVKDNEYGCGVAGAELVWGSNKYPGTLDDKTGECVFRGINLPPYNAVPKIIVWDKFDNKNTYYFTANSLETNIGELIIEDPETADQRVSLMMENEEALVDLVVDEGIKVDKEQWYDKEVPYKIVVRDRGVYRSGLKEVNVYNGDTKLYTVDNNGDVYFDKVQFLEDFFEHSNTISEEGNYILRAEAVDNAGNSSTKTKSIHIDKTNPEITEFTINGTSEKAPFVHDDTYGYFFKNDATIRVYVNDPGNSSGIAYVTLYKNEAGGNEFNWTVDRTMLKSDNNRQYAEFQIPKGFKGHIAAEVFDNVGHHSQKLGPDGAVVEDDQLHSEHATVTITPLGESVNGFYNHALALNVTVKDTFSGISNIEWSIGKDNKSGHLNASTYDMSLISDQPVDEKIVSTDANLITEVSFQLLVEADESDNPVNVTMTDNAGNTMSSSAQYSLDLTAPAVSTSLGNNDAKNGMYYDKDQQVNLSIVEKNFNGSDAKVLVNGVEQKVAWSGDDSGNGLTHTAKVDLTEDGEYNIKVEYKDLAGNPGTYDPGQHFIIDKTKPVITNNFADFKTGTPDEISGSTELYYNNQGDRKAAFEINVTEKNFVEEDLNIRVFSKSAGSSHKENKDEEWFETRPEYTWTHDTAKDSHRLSFELKEDGVYKIEVTPVDRAGNHGELAEGSDTKTDIFEVDTTAPVLGARNEGDYSELTEDKYKALAVYDIDRFEDEAPYVEFTDTNLYRLEYEMTTFKPTYSGGREIGKILPEEKKSDEDYSKFEKDKAINIAKSEKALEQDVIRYTVPDFEEDGVYAVKLYAVDMAGNKSEISDNTYVRMMNTSMLAYIENSNKVNCTGWYSFEDEEYGPISKQPTSFDDLDIVMFSKAGSAPKLLLVDKDTEAETDTHATADGVSLIEDELYMVDATKYKLSGEYFATNFTEDTDTRLYLRAENNGEYVDLGEMYIDNTKPECAVPDYLSNWGWLRGSGEKTITFSNISEILDEKETVVYINGQEVTANGLRASVDGKEVVAAYNAKDDSLSVTLPSGTYSIGAKLVDKAGNMRIITEVEHFSVGNQRIWLGTAGAAMLIMTVGGVTAVARGRRRRLSNK